MRDRRELSLGVVLVLVGVFFLFRRLTPLSGPGPVLVLVGAILLTLAALRGFRGPLLPGGVCLGLGIGFLVESPLSRVFPRWGVLLLGLSAGFLLVAAIDRAAGRERRPAPLVPGLLLLAISLASAAPRLSDLAGLTAVLAGIWPWLLIGLGILLVATSLRPKRRRLL